MKKIDKDIENILSRYYFTFHQENSSIITNTSQFSSFDKLFYESFPSLTFEQKTSINYISDMLYIATMATDKVIDETKDGNWQELFFFSKILWEKAQHHLLQLFPPDHVFWTKYEYYNYQYTASCIREKKVYFNTVKDQYSAKEYRLISSGKAAIAKVPVVAMCYLSGQEDFIPNFENSIESYFIGLQIKDDLIDWKSDLVNKRYSFLLTKIIELKNWKDDIDNISVEAFGRVIFFGNYAMEYLESGYRFHQKSLDKLAPVSCPDWENFVQKGAKSIRKLQYQIKDIVEKEIENVKL